MTVIGGDGKPTILDARLFEVLARLVRSSTPIRQRSRSGPRRHDLVALLREAGADVADSLVLPGPMVATLGPQIDACEAARQIAHPSVCVAGGESTTSGVQPKVASGRRHHGWCSAVNRQPSTRIVKPTEPERARAAFSEEWLASIARAVGPLDHDVWLEQFGARPALYVGGRRLLRDIVAVAVAIAEEARSWGLRADQVMSIVRGTAEAVLDMARVSDPHDTIAIHLPGYATQAAVAQLEGRAVGLALGEFPSIEPLDVV